MKFQLTFSLDKAEIPTKDYRRIFASIIKNALSRYMDGQLFEKFYKDTKQKDFTWSVIFNKPDFSGEGIKLGKNEKTKSDCVGHIIMGWCILLGGKISINYSRSRLCKQLYLAWVLLWIC